MTASQEVPAGQPNNGYWIAALPRVIIEGREYVTPQPITIEIKAGYVEITDGTSMPVNVCEHCHRFDVRARIAHSIDEAVTMGMLVPVDT